MKHTTWNYWLRGKDYPSIMVGEACTLDAAEHHLQVMFGYERVVRVEPYDYSENKAAEDSPGEGS